MAVRSSLLGMSKDALTKSQDCLKCDKDDMNRHAKWTRESREASTYTTNYRPLSNAGTGKLPQEGTAIAFLTPSVSPENTLISNILQTEQFVFMYLEMCVSVCIVYNNKE